MASLRFNSSRTVMNHQMRKQLSVIEESSQESIEEQKILNDMRMIRWVSFINFSKNVLSNYPIIGNELLSHQ